MIWKSLDHANLAEALLAQGKFEAARETCRLALAEAPSARLYISLGRAYDGLEQPDEAMAAANRALALEPVGQQGSAANILKALVYSSADDGERAVAAARRAIELAPESVSAYALMGAVLSWNGDLRGALPFIEWNWIPEQRYCQARFASVPLWNGGDLRGQRLLVAHLQGLGDMIQMARYLPLLRSRCERVIVECATPIVELMRGVAGVDDVVDVSIGAAPGTYDTYVRLMTLPRLLGIGPDAIGNGAYMQADPDRVQRWHPNLGEDGPLRVGLAWAGNPAHPADFQRSIPLDALAPLRLVPNVRWCSLMPGPGFDDLADTAAVIAQLDLVISVDTAVAHLAGALGRPVWTILQPRPDWRWAGRDERTPWYPSMRLFRKSHAEWNGVVGRIHQLLGEASAQRTTSA